MPEVEQLESGSFDGPNAPASQTLAAQLDFVTKFLRRRYLTILVCMLLSLVGGALFLYMAKPLYTASATMLLEARRVHFRIRFWAATIPLPTGLGLKAR